MAELTACPTWLGADWQSLYTRHARGQLPHAILITGMPGMGKRAFAQFLAESLLCRHVSETTGACGNCRSCRTLISEAHPDYRKLVPEGASQTVKVDAVRELVEWLQLTAEQGSYKIALIDSADTMNRSAANGLLKTLEEPGDAAILILVADRAGALPATVRSRCQTTTIRLRDRQSALHWLNGQVDEPEVALDAARGAPLLAVSTFGADSREANERLLKAWLDLFLHRASVGRIVDSVSDLKTSTCLQAFCRWTSLAVLEQANVQNGVKNATTEAISQVQGQLENAQWFTLYDRLLQLNRSDSASFKTQAVLEGLFADIRLMIQGSRCLQ